MITEAMVEKAWATFYGGVRHQDRRKPRRGSARYREELDEVRRALLAIEGDLEIAALERALARVRPEALVLNGMARQT